MGCGTIRIGLRSTLMRMTLRHAPPEFSSIQEYGSRLDDTTFWKPYLQAVAKLEGLPNTDWEPGIPGTFATFLAGEVVVKLFGYYRWWRECHEAELEVHRVLLNHPEIPAPALLAEGQLYDEPNPWPYLITRRISGVAWRDANLKSGDQMRLARNLGEITRLVHDLTPPTTPVFKRDWLAEYREKCIERHRKWAILPSRLIDQIEDYLVEPLNDRQLIHGDLTKDHLFVNGPHLVGLIDWGDAIATDPYYELGPLHIDLFSGDRSLLREFLTAYRWPVASDFADRAMSLVLMHEFNVLSPVREILDLETVPTLSDLATRLWSVEDG